MKRVGTRSFSGPYFPAFGLNTERYWKIRENADQKNPKYRHFPRSVIHGTRFNDVYINSILLLDVIYDNTSRKPSSNEKVIPRHAELRLTHSKKKESVKKE